ncbi:MAG: hypothetical protein ACLSAF_07730 [Intestinimonas sp.]
MDKRGGGSILYDALAPACRRAGAVLSHRHRKAGDLLLDRATGPTCGRRGGPGQGRPHERRTAWVRAPASSAGTGGERRLSPARTDGGPSTCPRARFSGGRAVDFHRDRAAGRPASSLTAETPGSAGNTWFGTLFPIRLYNAESLAGRSCGENLLVPGDDAETTECLGHATSALYLESHGSLPAATGRTTTGEKVLSLPRRGRGGKDLPHAGEGGTVGLSLVRRP